MGPDVGRLDLLGFPTSWTVKVLLWTSEGSILGPIVHGVHMF